jgi:hypothetical protein
MNQSTNIRIEDITKVKAGQFAFENELFQAYVENTNNQWRVSISDKTKVMRHTTLYYPTAQVAVKVLVETLNAIPNSFMWNKAKLRKG